MTFGVIRGTARFLAGVIVIGALFVAMVGEADTRSLGVTAADTGGTSANIVLVDMIPTFFDKLAGNGSDDKPKAKAS